MNTTTQAALFGGAAFLASTAIAINHDRTFLGGMHSPVEGVGMALREHVLGSMAAAAVLGAGIYAMTQHDTKMGVTLLAVSGGIALGTVAGHMAWDGWLTHQGITEIAPATTASRRGLPHPVPPTGG